jgi:hypothetical protein
MLTILNEHYYIDLDLISDSVTYDTSISGDSEQHISVVKYELIKIMVDVVLSESEETDEKLGHKSNLSIPFKLAFNTLLNNKIINKY